jgi:hemolysin-activating ACP:hemolysin acyltransferase
MSSNRKLFRFARFDDSDYALGRIVNLLRGVSLFVHYPFGRVANVVMGQIKRNHYIYMTRNEMPFGYAGWAMCAEEVARDWVEGRTVPTFEQCIDGDCWVGITFHAASREACIAQARFVRSLYPGAKAFGIRDYGSHVRGAETMNRAFVTDGDW